MNRANLAVLPAASLLSAVALGQPAALDTFGAGNSFDTGASLTAVGPTALQAPPRAHAIMFTAQESGDIAQIETALIHQIGDNTYTLQVRTGNANMVGPPIGSWSVSGGSTADPIVTASVGGTVQLTAGQTYFIALIAEGSATGAWHLNDQNMFSNAYATSSNQGGTFFFVNGSRLPAARISLVGPPVCYPDCDGNNVLNINDFLCFIDAFAQGDPYADCDGNGALNINDFLCFIDEFAQGC